MTSERGTEIEFELAITPEPTPEERAAIGSALERLRKQTLGAGGAWWAAGLSENLGLDED